MYFDLDGGGWCEWDRISSAGEGRYGHVMAVYKKTLLVFGGEKREGPEYCHHVCVNETRIYYPGCEESGGKGMMMMQSLKGCYNRD